MFSRLFDDVEVDGRRVSVRVEHGIVTHVAPFGAPVRGADDVVHGEGAALLPGLNDHHLRLLDLATRTSSVACGARDLIGVDALQIALRAAPGTGWVRGADYDEAVAGRLDRHVLDALVPDRPVWVHHRDRDHSVLNSRGVAVVRDVLGHSPAVERDDRGVPTGRLWRYDEHLASLVGGSLADLARVGRTLASHGITGVTDATPFLDAASTATLIEAAQRGALPRTLLLGVSHDVPLPERLGAGAWMLPMRAGSLPTFDQLADVFRETHAGGRPVAVAAESLEAVDLLLAVTDEVGRMPGDRIELSAVLPQDRLDRLVGFAVVTRPGSDAHQALLGAGVPMASGSGDHADEPSPWLAIAAAAREAGANAGEYARETLAGYLRPAHSPRGLARRIEVGERANLVLLDAPRRRSRPPRRRPGPPPRGVGLRGDRAAARAARDQRRLTRGSGEQVRQPRQAGRFRPRGRARSRAARGRGPERGRSARPW